MAETAQKQQGKVVSAEPKEVRKRQPKWLSPFEEMEHLFGDFPPRGWMHPFRWEWPSRLLGPSFEGRLPRVDVLDRNDAVVVRAEVPGLRKEDLDVSLSERSVTIRGSSRREEKEERADYYRCETARGEFARTVPLPADINAGRAQAKLKDGVLELILPKLESAKRHTVEIKEE